MHDDSHLSDQQLLLNLDNELSAQDAKRVHEHLGECWKCRTRSQELESTIGEFVRNFPHPNPLFILCTDFDGCLRPAPPDCSALAC